MAEDTKEKNYLEKEDSPEEVEEVEKEEEEKKEEEKKDTPSLARNGSWAAVWSADAQKYYFWNSETNETTWDNPIVPTQTDTDSIGNAQARSTSQEQEQEEKDYGGIDPDLAYLDPSLASGTGSAGGSRATFNHKGVFTRDADRNPDHVSEYSRSRRQNAVYFDVDAWEQQVDSEQSRKRALEEDADPKHRRLSKNQVQSFKEKRAEKRAKKQRAWLLS